ncbi:MAG: RsiV family protein [Paludibacter sp.]
MKKQHIILFVCILIPVLFFSCTQKTVKTEEKDLTQKFYLVSDTSKGSLSVDIHVELPVDFKNKAVLDSVRNIIISNLFGKEFISQSNDSVVQLYIKMLHTDYKDNNEALVNELDTASSYSFNNEHTLEGFGLISDKHIYSYGIDRYIYMGGAHGLNTRNYFNFDLKTGKLISEKDLFVANYESALSELIKKRIFEDSKEEQAKEPNTESILSLDDTDFWTDSIKPNGNFYITDESINYIFNPYEIAPYYMGITEVSLPYDRLEDLLKPNSLIAYLVKKQDK